MSGSSKIFQKVHDASAGTIIIIVEPFPKCDLNGKNSDTDEFNFT